MSLLERDKEFIWHPFTQMKLVDEPLCIDRAEGCYLYAADGKKYLDGISSWWVNIHGHGNKHVAEQLTKQALKLDHVLFAGITHEPAVTLAEELIKLLGNRYSKAFYSDNGSTAVEVALKMAIQYWKNKGVKNKTRIIALEDAYHGDTFGAMAVGERSIFTAAFHDMLFEVERLPLPTDENIDKCAEQLTKMCRLGQVAAFIFEPLVLGAAGMRMYKPEHLERLVSAAKEHNVLCIADEVMTGFGRTGKNFATEHISTSPDIICVSKGITAGILPLAITFCKQEIFDAFYSDESAKALFHGHSYTANPIACAAALASLELLLKKECQQQIQMISREHRSFVENIKSHKLVKEARSTGTILAVEIKTEEGTSYFHSIKNEAYKFFLNKGLLLRPLGNIVYFMPPYCITKEELGYVYSSIEEFLTHLTGI